MSGNGAIVPISLIAIVVLGVVFICGANYGVTKGVEYIKQQAVENGAAIWHPQTKELIWMGNVR